MPPPATRDRRGPAGFGGNDGSPAPAGGCNNSRDQATRGTDWSRPIRFRHSLTTSRRPQILDALGRLAPKGDPVKAPTNLE